VVSTADTDQSFSDAKRRREKPSYDGNGACLAMWRTALITQLGGVGVLSGEIFRWARIRKISVLSLATFFDT
jgi:hypothetical protein